MAEKDIEQEELDKDLSTDLDEGDDDEDEEAADETLASDADSDTAASDVEDAGESDEDREAIRARRREERHARKERVKQREESLQRQLASEKEARQQLEQRLQVIERKNTGSEMAQLDQAERTVAQEYAYYKQQIRLATEAANGAAMEQAQEGMMVAMRKLENLKNIKQAFVQRQQQPAPLDARLVNNAKNWMDKNRWYNPAGKDEDSRIALTIDNSMAAEGWNPSDPQYWQELDSRLKKYLPHRYNSGNNATRKTGSPVAGSGREAGAGSGTKGTYKLSAERVAALKDAGMWNDLKQREDAIKRFREYDRENGIK